MNNKSFDLMCFGEIMLRLSPPENERVVRGEIGEEHYIDVFSLYAQFKDDKDERVQIEIESLVNNILW